MRGIQVRRCAGERHLDARGAPWDEICEVALADAEEGLVDVGWVGFALDDVEDADVAAGLAGLSADHLILGLKESAHDIEHGGFADGARGFDVLAGEGRVARL